MRRCQGTATSLLSMLAGVATSQHAIAQSTDPFPAEFELSSLNGSNGFVLKGIDANDRSGNSVSSAGDVNGDGVDDLIIGADAADPEGISNAGESYVVFGREDVGFGGTIELTSLDGTNGFVLTGIETNDISGSSVSSAGDVNGDGVDDLLIGARFAAANGNGQAGQSYVVFGGNGVGSSGAINLSALNGSNGFVLIGSKERDFSGFSVSEAGDVNSDGIDDLIIGANGADPNGIVSAGVSYVVFGSVGLGSTGVIELSALNGSNGFVLNGIGPSDSSGASVSSAGDLNGDGVDDLIVGAYGGDPNGNATAGESYVVFGGVGVGSSGVLELSSLNGSNGYVLNGVDAGDRSGTSVSAAGDVNGDGVDDLIIGAHTADPNGNSSAGESYVVFGGTGVGSTGVVELSALNGSNGFVLNGIDANDFSGQSVAGVGDVNGDGVDDLFIGAYSADPTVFSAGASYVVFGGEGVGSGGTFELSSLNGTNGFAINGIGSSDSSGRSVSTTGDVNGDGFNDLIIGAPGARPNGNIGAGESFVVFGRANTNVWTSPTGGGWDIGSNWRQGASPTGGFATIDTTFGVTVTGPFGAVFLDGLNLGAGFGRTTLDLLAGSLVSISGDFTVPSSAALSGAGVFAAGGAWTNFGLISPDDLVVIAPGGLSNQGDLDLSPLINPVGYARLQIGGPVTNETGGEILLRRGIVELEALDGVTNNGTLSVVFASADILGTINNTPTGQVSVSGASSLLITDDVTNASSIVLTDDSSLVILGAIFGNGVSGPGGSGTAGSVFVEGGVIPGLLGDPFGTARFDGDLDLGPTAYSTLEIGGTTPGVDHDQIRASGRLGAAGVLDVRVAQGFTPQPGDVYRVLEFGTVSGVFSGIVLDPALIAAGADTSELLASGRITIPEPCSPDFNGDGTLDLGDIQAFVALFLAPDPAADFNGDGVLDLGDITDFVAAFIAGC